MAMLSCIITGQRGTFKLAVPAPHFRFSRTDVDELDDSWHADRLVNEVLVEGQPHPDYPGMILDLMIPEVEVPEIEGQLGSYTVQCKWIGNAREGGINGPTKLISRGLERAIGPSFDEIPFGYISWTAEPRAITASYASGIFSLASNPYLNGQRVKLVNLFGGSGLAGQSDLSLGSDYYIIDRTADSFRLSASQGGSAVVFTTDVVGGYVLDARFAIGAVHPDFPNLFLAKLSLRDSYTSWKNASCTYVGKAWPKLYQRIVTVAGVQMSSSEKIIWSATDGWETALWSNVQLPEIVVSDTYLTTDALSTETIPLSSGEGGTPPSAPSIRSVILFGDEDTIVYNWPSGWSRLEEANVETLNVGINVHLKRRTSRYIWPIYLK